jgi:epoxyqueuosine reductase QueG
MAVAIIAPTIKKAARPANSWQAVHQEIATTMNIKPPTHASPFSRNPKMREMAS